MLAGLDVDELGEAEREVAVVVVVAVVEVAVVVVVVVEEEEGEVLAGLQQRINIQAFLRIGGSIGRMTGMKDISLAEP